MNEPKAFQTVQALHTQEPFQEHPRDSHRTVQNGPHTVAGTWSMHDIGQADMQCTAAGRRSANKKHATRRELCFDSCRLAALPSLPRTVKRPVGRQSGVPARSPLSPSPSRSLSGVRATGSPCGPLVRATPCLILRGWARLYNIGCPNVVFPRMGSLCARHR